MLGVVLAALISPVPLLTVTYAVEYECDVGLGAAAVNAANFCSFALLMGVANADLSSPATVRAFAAAGAALAALGAFGSARRRRRRETEARRKTRKPRSRRWT